MIVIGLFLVIFALPCFAATVAYDLNGNIEKILNLNVNSGLYSINFVEGTFNEVYPDGIPNLWGNSSIDFLVAIRTVLNNESPVPFSFANSSFSNIRIPREIIDKDWFGSDAITPLGEIWYEPLGLVAQYNDIVDQLGNYYCRSNSRNIFPFKYRPHLCFVK